MEYNFNAIEKKWQRFWEETKAYKVSNHSDKPKYYVLDMFPYPSGAGLHVGHPLGYIASDIFSRFKNLQGYNVLHPMGYDAFGLPAEQYAIENGVHPAVSTEQNIQNFRSQLNNIGFCFDWDREVRTSDPAYYKWTQWIFLQLFHSFFNRKVQKAEPVDKLIKTFETKGNIDHPFPDDKFSCPGISNPKQFTAEDWQNFDARIRHDILMEYRLAYCGYGEVNWCEALGTVLANDEVINGVSERGGHPVVRKKLRQWYLRITEYADRLLEGLNHIDFSDSMKEMQTNWIGKSSGAEIDFAIRDENRTGHTLRVYTTRPDTIFGVDFMVIAPELDMVPAITSAGQKQQVEDYLAFVKSRSERERQAEKTISGVFTGAWAIHPFSGAEIPIWISEYVLAGYGTGAIMGVPCGDERDHKFAKYFNIPITNIIGNHYDGENANPTKDAILENSGFLNGMEMRDAIETVVDALEAKGIGTRKTNYKMRDAAFSRQRYWGEPFPIVWKDGMAFPLPESELPLELPEVESYKPGPEGEGPLANLNDWKTVPVPNTSETTKEYGIRETNTMPGYAGSSWYFLRYMDPHNDSEFCSRRASDYWNQVDLYVGGTEHAVGHLLYSRMWTKALYDLGFIGFDEPFKKLLNQGMIQGSSRFVYRIAGTNQFVSYARKADYHVEPLHVDVSLVDGYELDIEAFKKWKPDFADAEFVFEDGSLSAEGAESNARYITGGEVEKMSKRYFNTVNPDDLVAKYGADTFRMYEMFLGPVEISKPWDTKGIEGVHRFLKKFWRLFYDEIKGWIVTDEIPAAGEFKSLHKALKKVREDTEKFSFNTAVSTFMVCVNELTEQKSHKRQVLEPLVTALSPYAPHVAEELFRALGNTGSVLDAIYPEINVEYLVESTKEYPVSINGKLRTTMQFPADAEQSDVEGEVLANEIVQKWVEGKTVKKFVFVKGRMINVVV